MGVVCRKTSRICLCSFAHQFRTRPYGPSDVLTPAQQLAACKQTREGLKKNVEFLANSANVTFLGWLSAPFKLLLVTSNDRG